MGTKRGLRESRKAVLDAAIRAAQTDLSGHELYVRSGFTALLHAVQSRTRVLNPRVNASLRGRLIVRALVHLALHRWSWCAPLSAWTPPSTKSDALVISSLAEHLLAQFPLPRFMTSVWGSEEPLAHRWFMQLGAGESVRQLDLCPFRLSRAAAHAFRDAPADLDVISAFRWAQVRALGGSLPLARAIALSGAALERFHDDFWESVFAFFVAHPEIDVSIVPHVIEFIRERNAELGVCSIDVLLETSNLSAADFAIAALGQKSRERLVHEWRNRPRPPANVPPPRLTWKRAPFAGLLWMHVDPKDARLRTWHIVELTTSEELREEGNAMHHCVATYADKCASGNASIWSMLVDEEGRKSRVLTIEVDVTQRLIRQAKRCANERPRPREMEVLLRWAAREGLALDGSLPNVAEARPP